jgi:photosystem II stability/assembly factor-like uncharacterized protein
MYAGQRENIQDQQGPNAHDYGGVYKSTDGGDTWQRINSVNPRPMYFSVVKVDPNDDKLLYVLGVSIFRSRDGGKTFRTDVRGFHADQHALWINPKDGRHMIVGCDGGFYVSYDRGANWDHLNHNAIGQFYHVAVSSKRPYWVFGGLQDNGSWGGPSVGLRGGGAVNEDWVSVGGGDGFVCRVDPNDPDLVYTESQGGVMGRINLRTVERGSTRPVRAPGQAGGPGAGGRAGADAGPADRPARPAAEDAPPADRPAGGRRGGPAADQYRFNWNSPFLLSSHNSHIFYSAGNHVFRSYKQGADAKVISPEITLTKRGSATALAESPRNADVLWVGTDDGGLWLTKDGGAKWIDVSKNVTGLPAWGVVSKIEPSHFSGGTAYVAVDAHLMDSHEPYIFKTTDYGATWKRVNGDLPNTHPLSYVKAVAENPNKQGMLFAGTGHAFYYSTDDGSHWTALAAGLPHAPVSWVVVQKQFHDVVVSTYGRGLYVLDDITPLEQASPATTDAAAHLFTPRPSYRWTQRGRALINFSLKTAPKVAQMHVLDADGKQVRDVRVTPRAGLNRVSWDLRYDAPRLIALRTTPPENPHIWEEPRFRGQDTRPVTHWGLDQAQVGPIVTPGKYTVKLTVDGQSYTQPIEILKDPKIPSSVADLDLSVKLQLRLRDDISAAADMVNTLEVMRKQLEDVQKAYKNDASKAPLLKQVAEMDKKLFDLEARLLEPAQMTSDDKYFQQAYRVYMNLIWLNGEVGPGAGDVAGGADFPPTDTSVGMLENIEKDLTAAKSDYRSLMDRDVPAFNRAIGGVITPLTGGR